MRYTLKLLTCFIFVLVGGSSLLHAKPPHTRFQAIIFDCDGVLVDTEYLKFLAWKEALEAQGIPFSIEEYMPLVGHSSKNILQMIREAKNIDILEEVIEVKNGKYKLLQKHGVPPIPEMVSFALRLVESKQQLSVRLALASSAPKEEILANLKQIGLENAFDLIISGSDDLEAYTDAEGTNKPKPYIYIESAKRLGISPEFCLVFEDTKAGVDAAASAGMVAVAVPNQFTLTHDFSNAYRIISSYEEFASFGVLTMVNEKQ
jgi:beta-phosphoglucomutase